MTSNLIVALIAIWLYFFSITLLGNFYFPAYWELICEVCQLVNMIMVIYLSVRIYINAPTPDRKLFILFIISNILLFLSAIGYFIVTYIFSLTNVHKIISLVYLIPSVLWISVGVVYWVKLVWVHFKIKNNWFVNIAILLVNLCIVYMISQLQLTHSFKLSIHFFTFQVYTNILSFFILNGALYTLICARSLGMRLLAAGTISIIGANFLTSYVMYTYHPSLIVYKNDFWLFSSSIWLSGLVYLILQKDYVQFESFVRDRSIKSILTAWTLCVVVLTVSLFLILTDGFNLLTSQLLSILPYVMFIYIIFATFASLIIAYVFEKSIEQVNNTIDHFIKDPLTKENLSKINIAEFMVLNEFLVFTMNIIAERNKIKDQISKLAGKVAHDIRSPISSLLMIAKFSDDIPENTRIILRDATSRIDDIANSLLNYYKPAAATQVQQSEDILVSAAIMQIITEKRYEYQHLSVKIIYEITQNGYFVFIKIKDSALKRMLSNLINNAVDAFEGRDGCIIVKLDCNEEHISIAVEDNGKGISVENINKIQQKVAFTTGKNDGHGIGLVQVRETLDMYNGVLKIESMVNVGTKIILTLPKIVTPNWMATEIRVNNNDIIVIIDDDISIHGAWDSRFLPILTDNSSLLVTHFSNGQEALDFINKLSSIEQVFLLADYELLGQNLNGIEIIQKSGVRRSVLVTSHYADKNIQYAAQNIGIKILPKKLTSEARIKIECLV